VRVNPAVPGLMASGISGWLISGTGFAGVVVALSLACAEASCAGLAGAVNATKTETAMKKLNVRDFIFCPSSYNGDGACPERSRR